MPTSFRSWEILTFLQPICCLRKYNVCKGKLPFPNAERCGHRSLQVQIITFYKKKQQAAKPAVFSFIHNLLQTLQYLQVCILMHCRFYQVSLFLYCHLLLICGQFYCQFRIFHEDNMWKFFSFPLCPKVCRI